MKREIAPKGGNFRGVCPASSLWAARNRAAECFLVPRRYAYIVCTGETGRIRAAVMLLCAPKAGLFFGQSLIRTVWWKEKAHPYDTRSGSPNAAEYRTNLEENTHGNREETDPHPSQGL